MKLKCKLIVILLFTAINGKAQKGVKKSCVMVIKPMHTVITGTAPDSMTKLVGNIVDYSKYLHWSEGLSTIEIPVINGRWRYEVELTNPVFFYGAGFPPAYPLILEPGDSLSLKWNSWDFSPTKKGGCRQNCIAVIRKNSWLYTDWETEKSLRTYDMIRKMVLDVVNIYKPKLSPTAYSMLNALYSPDLSEIIMKDKWAASKNKKVFLTKLQEYWRSLNFKDSALLYVRGLPEKMYKNALLQYALENRIPFDSVMYKFSGKNYSALLKYLPNGPIKEKTIATYLLDAFTIYEFSDELKVAVSKYLSQSDTSSSFYKGLAYNLRLAETRLEKGTDAYAFALPDTSGAIIKMKDFLGKLVVIDFMYSGCIGCMNMVPILSKVESNYKGNENVVFISISIDFEKEKWKKSAFTGVYSVPGSIQLYTGGLGYNHPIIKHYDISAYPTLIVIDKNGKLLTARAPNPRIDEGVALTTLINSELK